jgi:beta-barrel assembly-enhancing protease
MLMLLAMFLIAARANSNDIGAALLQLQAMDFRVAVISQRVATHGTAFCKVQSNWPGIVVHEAADYDRSATAARKAFGLGSGTAVSVVVPGSPADRSGIQTRDVFEMINGQLVSGAQAARKQLMSRGLITLTINRAGTQMRITLPDLAGCASGVVVVPSPKADAGADGETVRIRTAMIESAANDDELAYVIAHELSHNILGHPALLDKSGRRASRVLPTEIAADQMGVKLMAKAGYDPRAAARFIARFGRKGLARLFEDGTHQGTKDRVRTLEDAAAAVAQ